MRRRAKIDANHAEIVRALRQAGASVQSLAAVGDGCPDILVGLAGKNYVFEIKDGNLSPSRQKLTTDEWAWHKAWCGQVRVVTSVSEALAILERAK